MSNRLSIKGKLKVSSPPFKFPNMDAIVAKYFVKIAQEKFNDFLSNPQSKNFDDFQHFIEFISPKDFDKLPDKKRREEQSLNKGSRAGIHPAVFQAFYMKQNSMNQLESQASNENFMSEITENSFQTLGKKGKCLSGLYVDKIMQGPRYLLYMIDCSNDIAEIEEKYKDHQFEVDDQVAFCYIEYSPYISAIGTVYQKLNNGIVISIDGSQINEEIYSRFRSGEPFSLVKQEYQAVFEVNNKSLEKILKISFGSQEPFHNNLSMLPPRFLPPQQGSGCTPLIEDLLRESLDDQESEFNEDSGEIVFLDQGLNEDQQKAVKAALSARNLYLIDGPAGTGKTRVLAELIHQYVKKGLKVLACGPSVHAVDNLIGRMLNKEIKACRIGKSGNPNENIDRFSMDTLLKKNKRIKIIQDECDTLLESFKITEHKLFLKRMEETAETVNKHHIGVSKLVVDYSNVVFSTLRGASASVLEQNNFSFDVVIIDECSQATEISAWAAILKTKKLIIAGDRLQLPPFIISGKAKKIGLNFTLFDRLRKGLPKNLRQVLRVQYRMNEKIMAWSNEHFYKGKLIANDICAQYTIQEYLKDSSQIKEDQVPVLMLVDTKDSDFKEKRGTSYSNIGEAAVVLELLGYLLENYDLKSEEIGVISPYQNQHELITKAIECKSDLRGIKCQTVDYFQGKEKEVIIISLVRSNKDKIVGFLDDARRMNVAVTRAKRFVAIVCDTSTVCQPGLPFMLKLISHFKKEGQVLTPDDFKGVGYQTRFLQSVLNGEIEPPENKKSEVKVMKNMDAINQVLNSHHLEEEKEEEKIQMDKYQKRKTEIKEKLQKVCQSPRKSFKSSFANQGLAESFLMLPPGTPQNESIMPFIPAEVSYSHSEKNDIVMNYSHSQSELANQDESENNRLVGNASIFAKDESKKKQPGGIQIRLEDFPELGVVRINEKKR